ncbi:MAG: putative oxidoreductase [Haloplasmataceae bacterium]|jgi:uncharacterized FAD-dependent dehydrogenase|nr:putative oxidoreductase [Haloplasmataceae bacterium]
MLKSLFKRNYTSLKKDIDTGVLIIGNNLSSVLTAYEFSEKNINTVVIDKDIIHYHKNTDQLIESECYNLNKYNSVNESNKMDLFKEILGIVYELDDVNKKLKDKINYSRNPNISYKTERGVNSFQLFSEIYYDFGISINKFKLVKELFKFLKKKKVRVYSQTEVVFYSIDNKNNVVVMTNKGYKINCKKIIITANNTNLYSSDGSLEKNSIVNNYNLTNGVLDNLLNAKTILNQYLGS